MQEQPQQNQSSLLHNNRDLAILYTIAGYLNRQIDVHDALQEVLVRVTELLGLRTAWVWVFDEAGEPGLAAALNLPPYLADHLERMIGSCLCLDTFMQGKGRASNIDFLRCTRLKNAERESDPSALGLRFHSSIPIYAGNTLMGVLNVASEDWRELHLSELQLLHIISDQIGLAMQRASLSAEHEHAAARLATIEERNRLAREIHDTLAQGLAAISLQLEAADTLVTTNPERAQNAIKRALTLARSNLEEARRSVMDLRAAPLQGHTLPEALTTLVQQQQVSEAASTPEKKTTGKSNTPTISFTYSPEPIFPPLSPRIEAAIYRIVQEGLTNARKYAEADHITVRLVAEEQWINLLIIDDGQGFETENILQGKEGATKHFGLSGISERVRLLGGSFYILSKPGAGTRLEVSVPY